MSETESRESLFGIGTRVAYRNGYVDGHEAVSLGVVCEVSENGLLAITWDDGYVDVDGAFYEQRELLIVQEKRP